MKNSVVRSKRFRKGVALVFAMFVAALMAAMSTTVVARAISNSKSTSLEDYDNIALQAANWGTEAAINYMGQPGSNYDPSNSAFGKLQWEETKTYPEGKNLKVISSANGLNNMVTIKVDSLDSAQLADYGLNYTTTKTLGGDLWQKGDSRRIRFYSASGSGSSGEYKLEFGDGNYANVEVICTEQRTLGQPSIYQLWSVAKIYNPKGAEIATRIVDTRVRELMASDFMHFIQNARSWDANGVDLSQNNQTDGGKSARTAVLLPEGYKERGRLRVDGYNNRKDPEKSTLKKYLHSLGVDGTIGFFSEDNKFEPGKYSFDGDVYTEKGSNTFAFRSRGVNQDKSIDDKVRTKSFTALSDNAGSMGLPQAENYFEQATKKSTTVVPNSGKRPVNIVIGATSTEASDRASITSKYGLTSNLSKCPDIAQGTTTGYDNKGNKKTNMPATVPTFATVRVEIKGDEARILKYNTAISNGATGKNVEDITPGGGKIKIDKINNGLINVTGGNVEVVNVTKFGAKGSGSNGYTFGDTDTKLGVYDPGEKTKSEFADNALNGSLTVVSNVNASRDKALQNVGSGAKNNINSGSFSSGAIYSTEARNNLYEKYLEDKANTSLAPPYSLNQLTGSGSTVKNIWPEPSSSSVEREGNVVIGSDIVYKDGNSSFGIVANNFIYLNDRGANNAGKDSRSKYQNGSSETAVKSRTMSVDGILMSMDHSVQFDWNNLTQNPAWSNISSDARTSGKLDPNKLRTFHLNGAVVGGFLDVEGDTYGRGYYNQDFYHDKNLRNNLPPCFPKWEFSKVCENQIFMPWVILSFQDKGAINDLK